MNLKYLTLMNDEADQNNSFLEIHAGAGGTESQDWAEMLQRMYVRWAESKKFDISLLQESKGEEAGIKSSTLKISGDYVYGRLKRESGIHRLVRISPFDSNKRRHTSFASIWVYPEIDDKVEIEINEGDLRIDTYRASGAGGQHINKTDSAVRITHIPTHIVVQCQSGRSQHKNKSNAITMLKSRLYELELQKRKEEEAKKKEEEAIRTYEDELEDQLTEEEITGFQLEKTDLDKMCNRVCEIIADYESVGILQSQLWKKFKLSSRDGSRLALKLERMGMITREKILEKERWTYKLIIKKIPISTKSIEGAPCLTCPVQPKCSIDGEISPKTCQWIEDWVLIELKK